MSDDILQVGVESDDVLDAQDRLRFLRLYEGQINGYFDTATQQAVEAFQHHTGAAATGTLDTFGLQHLREYADHYHYGYGAMYYDEVQHHGHHQEHYAHHDAHATHQQHHAEHHGHGHHEHQVLSDQDRMQLAAAGVDVHPVDLRDDAHTLHAGQTTYWTTMRTTVSSVHQRALDTARLNDEAFLRAVDAFERYAKHEVADFQDAEITGELVVKQIIRSCMDFMGIRFCSSITNGLLKFVAEGISTGLARFAANTGMMEVHKISTGAQLDQQLRHLVHSLKEDEAGCMADLRAGIEAAFTPLYRSISNEERLAPADEEWLAQCYGLGGTDLDAPIEHLLGLPSPARVPEIESAIYQGLVENFLIGVYEIDEQAKRNGRFLFTDRRTEGERWEDDPAHRARVAARAARAVHDEERTAHRHHDGQPQH